MGSFTKHPWGDSESAITLQRSESYRESGGPDQLTFVWMEDAAEDYGKLAAGELPICKGPRQE